MTLRTLLRKASARLEQANVPDPQYDARVLLLHAFHLDTAHFLFLEEKELNEVIPDRSLREEALLSFRRTAEKRAARIPLQQILGTAGFYGMDFTVSDAVLSPRQDTETLVDEVLKKVDRSAEKLLDICTGSGCIAIALAKYGTFRETLAVDISAPALEIAGKNAAALLPEDILQKGTAAVTRKASGENAEDAEESAGRRCFTLLHSDLFQAIPEYLRDRGCGDTAYFDVIVSNPPYIRSAVVDTLEPEVRDHEPRIALDGDADGLRFYRIIAAEAPAYLKHGGWLFLETGYDQGADVSALLRENAFTGVGICRDLAGQDRVVMGRKA